MPETHLRQSPIHQLLQRQEPEWSEIAGAPIVVNYQSVEAEQSTMQRLGLCDLSPLTKLGLKGTSAESWLQDQKIDVPGTIFDSNRLVDRGYIVRLGSDEFFLESGVKNETVPQLQKLLNDDHAGLYCVERQDATFLFVGTKAIDVLSQTCGIDFEKAISRQLIMSRVAGVSCSIFPEPVHDLPAFRLWLDPSFATYLWETLSEICKDLGGNSIGAGVIYPELNID